MHVFPHPLNSCNHACTIIQELRPLLVKIYRYSTISISSSRSADPTPSIQPNYDDVVVPTETQEYIYQDTSIVDQMKESTKKTSSYENHNIHVARYMQYIQAKLIRNYILHLSQTTGADLEANTKARLGRESTANCPPPSCTAY